MAREKTKRARAARSEPWNQIKDSDEAGEKAWSMADRLRKRQGPERKDRAEDCLALYEGHALADLGLLASAMWGAEAPSFNVVASIVDTRSSHVYRNKVRPFFLTSRGNWEHREKARGMQQCVEGTFHQAGIYGELGQHTCWDGEVFEAGVVKVTPDYANARPLLERVRAQDVYIDERDGMLGVPRQYTLIHSVPRASLLDFFKNEKKEITDAILDADPVGDEDLIEGESGDEETADRVMVAEIWFLPSGRVDRSKKEAWEVLKQHDGRHMIVLDGGKTLQDEAWPFPYPPLAFYRPKKRRRAFWSQSVPERQVGAQLAINRMLKRVDGIMHLHSRPLVYVNKQAKVNTDKITNSWASIIEGNGPAGSAIQYITPQSVPAEYIGQIQRIIAWAFESEGVSELSAAAKKPAGVEAAVAIQALQDTESIRHTDVFRAWEDFHVQLSKIVIDCFRMLAEHAPDFDVVWGDAKDLRRIQWKEVDLEELAYHLTVWPTNLLPQTPAARLQRVIDLMGQQLITPAQGLLLLDFPDIEAITGDANAAEQNISQKLEAVFRQKYPAEAAPSTYIALDMAWRMAVDRINRLEADGAPPEQIDFVRQWAEDVDELRQRAANQNAAGLGGAPTPQPPAPDGVPTNVPEGPLPGMAQAA